MNEEVVRRINRVHREMESANIDAILVFAPGWRRENFRYLTGASVSSAFAAAYLPSSGSIVAFVSSVADANSVKTVDWIDDVRLVPFPDCQEIAARIREDSTEDLRIGVSHWELVPRIIVESLKKVLPNVEFVSATDVMDRVRMVKSDWELEKIRSAGIVCSSAWEAFVDALHPGVMEYEVVAAVEAEIKRLGAEDNFMLFASGGNEVMGMTPPGNRRLEPGDMVRTELTPQLGGYYAQICRSAVVGEPNDGQRQSFELFNEALQAGLDAVHAGVTAGEIARAEDDVFRRHGYGEFTTSQYTRVRGHGHGLFVDEVPAILDGVETVLEENSVIIVHPNTYTPLAGYHVLGDPVVVKRDGYEPLLTTARILFSSPI